MSDPANPERWNKIKAAFLAALEVNPEERRDFVRGRCAREPEILTEVLELLGLIDEFPPGFIDPPFEPVAPPPLEGKTLGGFRIEREVGRGAMGIVYEATQLEFDRRCAIKVLPHNYRQNSAAIQRFRREATAVSRLNHPNIVQVYTSGESEGIFYYAMEFIDGESLADDLQRQRDGEVQADAPLDLQDPDCCARIIEGVARALQHAHDHRIIHRDIKPANILIDRDGVPRVVDFGLAKDERLESLSAVGMVVGTPYYMSPEQALTQTQSVDARSDIYSLGAVLYELLTLAHPHEGESSLEIFYKIAHDRPRPIQSLRPEVPRDLARICMKALERDPDHRIQTAAEVADLLDDFRNRRRLTLPRKPWRDRIAQASRSRLAGPLAIAAVAGLLTTTAFAVFAGESQAASSTEWTVERANAAGARVRSRPVAPGGQTGPWEEHGRMDSREVVLRVPRGSRIVRLDGDDGAFVEMRRECGADRVRSRGWLRADATATQGMVRIPAGPHTLTYRPKLSAPARTFTVQLGSYWIDRRPVSIGEFLAFLRATAPAAVEDWLPYQRMAKGLPRPDYLELPAVYVTIDQAREYAAWKGKRLPTFAEWQLAMGGAAPAWWKTALEAGEVERQFVYARPATLPDEKGRPSTSLAFIRFAVPVRDTDPGYGPHDIQQPFGNVCEWTATPALPPGHFLLAGHPWHLHAAFLSPELLGEARSRTEFPSFDLGFRCARSAE